MKDGLLGPGAVVTSDVPSRKVVASASAGVVGDGPPVQLLKNRGRQDG